MSYTHTNRLPKAHTDEQFKLFHTVVTKSGNQKFIWVSNYGNVFRTFDYKEGYQRIKTYNTATNKGRKGYLAFSGNDYPCKYLHQAVAKLFIPNPYELNEINHIDKDTHNNSIGNLEWVDRSANMKHAYGHEEYHNNYTLAI
jgi:hypothetical protein